LIEFAEIKKNGLMGDNSDQKFRRETVEKEHPQILATSDFLRAKP
jgi:hypothetical protein